MEIMSTIAMKHILILGCSATKKLTPGLMPAVLRYDGLLFRVLRRQPPAIHAIYILSALHGLNAADTPIALYDQRMRVAYHDEAWMQWRAEAVVRPLRRLAGEGDAVITLCMGNDYHQAIGDALDDAPAGVQASVDRARIVRLPPVRQSIGKMAQALKGYCLTHHRSGITPVWWPNYEKPSTFQNDADSD